MIDLIVVGRPKSLQSSPRSIEGWKQLVETAAQVTILDGPVYVTGPVHACFHWFCDVETARIPDLDNVLKPTFDALEGLAFTDDDQLTDIRATRIALNSLPVDPAFQAEYEAWPAELASHLERLSRPEEFVYIQIADPLSLLEVQWLPQH